MIMVTVMLQLNVAQTSLTVMVMDQNVFLIIGHVITTLIVQTVQMNQVVQ